MSVVVFEPKDPQATKRFEFDFSNEMAADEVIESVEVTLQYRNGPGDGATMADYLEGDAVIEGQKVIQLMSGGTHSNTYSMIVEATTDQGQVLVRKGRIPVRSTN